MNNCYRKYPRQATCCTMNLTQEQEQAMKPVSYTHLDVYKRQYRNYAGIFLSEKEEKL